MSCCKDNENQTGRGNNSCECGRSGGCNCNSSNENGCKCNCGKNSNANVKVGQMAPNFTAQAVMADGSIDPSFNLAQHFEGSYGVIFFYPLNFSFVCPSEIIALDNRHEKFKELNAKVITVSIDSPYSHLAWKNTPPNKGGIGNVKFTMVSDLTHEIGRKYGVAVGDGPSNRGTFILDRMGVIRNITINDLAIGRNIDEIIRTIEAIQFIEENGEVSPACWVKGEDGIKPDADGVSDYLSKNSNKL